MQRHLPGRLPLICPACRTRDQEGWRVYTVALTEALVTAPAGDEVEQGLLTCQNAACRRVFPIIDGIPVLVSDLGALLRSELPTLFLGAGAAPGAPHPALVQQLALAGTDQDALPALLEHLSVYLDAHWEEHAQPPPDWVGRAGEGAAPFGGVTGMAAVCQRLAARQAQPVALAVELGCSVGRGLAALAAGAALTVGVDLRLGALRQARQVLAGRRLRYLRRVVGRHYLPAEIHAPAVSAVALICGDALDPPLLPGAFDRVAALNLLDSVAAPPRLLSVLDALCRPGGEVILTSPYAWQSTVVAEDQRLGGADPAQALREILSQGRDLEAPYGIEDAAELPWLLRRDARLTHHYQVHYLRARKQPAR